jgi:GNAT superfamily N-acetyltransferase
MITFRPFDKKADVTAFLPIFWEYWYLVNGVDTSEVEELTLTDQGAPEVVRLPKIEAILYGYIYKGYDVQLAETENGIVGFVLYHDCFGAVLEVRGMYVDRAWRNEKLGAKLIDSIGLPIKQLIFQTRAKHPPERMLELTEGRREKIAETDELITWQMEWEPKKWISRD